MLGIAKRGVADRHDVAVPTTGGNTEVHSLSSIGVIQRGLPVRASMA